MVYFATKPGENIIPRTLIHMKEVGESRKRRKVKRESNFTVGMSRDWLLYSFTLYSKSAATLKCA